MKSSLRTAARRARDSLSTAKVAQQSQIICNQLIELSVYQHAQHIACYLPHKNEVDLDTFIQHAWQANKLIYLPVTDIHSTTMTFYRYTEHTQLHMSRFGIAEPVIGTSELIKPNELELMIVPMVAFDANRNRIGQGAGYYDRYLSQPRCAGITTVGVAFEAQKVADFARDEWDVTLDLIVTEQATY